MIFILDRDEQVVAILTNNGSPSSCPYYNDNFVDDVDTGSSSYEFTIPSNHEVSDLVQESGYVIRTDLDGNLIMFGITQIEETHTDVSEKIVYAENAGLELLNDIFRPNTYTSKNAREILDLVLFGTRWESGEVDYFGVDNYTFDKFDNIVAILQAIKNQLGSELRFRVEMENGEVTHRYVDLVEQLGTDTKKRFAFTKDITSIKRKIDTSQLVTALIGVGKGNSTGSNTDFKSVVKYGKPSGQDWIGDDDALQMYGKQGKHIFGVFEYETDNPTILLDKTYDELQKRKVPSFTYELYVALLERLTDSAEHEKVRKGDTVYIIDETFSPPLYLEARVLRLETCFSDPSQDKCELGNYRVVQSNITAQMRSIQSTLLKKETTWETIGDIILKQPDPPTNPAQDQLWRDTSKTIEVMNRWNGTDWVPSSPTTAAEIGAVDANVPDLASITNNLGNVSSGTINTGVVITQENPIEPSLNITDGWANYGTPYKNVSYWKDRNSIVHLSGVAKTGTAGTIIFTLPAEYRPIATEPFTVQTDGGITRIDINSSGEVIHVGSYTNYISLSGVLFRAYN